MLIAGGYFFLAWSIESGAGNRERYFVGRLPARVQHSEVIRTGERAYGFRGGCGAAIFGLSRETEIGLAEGGLKYLETARRSRIGGGDEAMDAYEAWANTPLPRESSSDRGWLGLECLPATDHGNDLLVKLIEHAGYEGGAYFTSARGTVTLVIIPKLHVVVYAFHDS